MNIRRILGWFVTIVLAGGVGLWSHAIGNEIRMPTPAPLFGYSLNPQAGGNFAFASFATREEQKRGTRVTRIERTLADRAYRTEPLSAPALAILAKAMMAEGAREKGVALLTLAGKLTRRNLLISRELIAASAERNDSRGFFTWLSRSVLTNEQARKTYILAMADATARPDAVEALLSVLGAKPRWADDYWRSVVTRPASLANAAALRMKLARGPWSQGALTPTDQTLIARLVNQRQFNTAERLALSLGLGHSNTQLVRNGDFARSPLFAPFDWELATLGNLGASINPNDKKLAISAIGGAKGLAAQQLLRLPPGHFQLSWSLSGNIPNQNGGLSIGIRCAELNVGAMAPLSVPLVAGKQRRDFVIENNNCRWFWLSMEMDVPDDALGLDAYIDNVSISPVAGNTPGS
ncbi:hypothetical protein [Sphingopyxis macrogoltabida]|uniref:Uncharacterized protein n=1 Tax=Sphingopyxis macrogoltabida TaxID=33050 RepID=A0A0N9V0R9_SPHMC|nr:hypothetical protein [Sphingopyxis macrogoltabida]ALH82294.1 hypothetical protein AN936_18645 [Sphingopyxis macrogoltabida]